MHKTVKIYKIYTKSYILSLKKIDKKVAFFIIICYNHLECGNVGYSALFPQIKLFKISFRRNDLMVKKISTLPFNGTPEQEAQLKAIIAECAGDKSMLMHVIQEAQNIYG